MWPVLLLFTLALGIIVIGTGVLIVVTFAGRNSLTDGFELDGVRVVRDGMVSVGVLQIDENKVALVDAGIDRSGRAILAELSRRGLGVDSVEAILLTHGHPDHVAAAPLFPRAVVMALEDDVELAEGRVRGRGPLVRLLPVRPGRVKVGRILRDGETVSLGRLSVRVYAVPGHSAGSAAFLANGVLFLGDSADAMRDGRLQGTPWLFADSVAQNRQSLVRLAGRLRQDGAEVRALVFSHSGVLTAGDEPLASFAHRH